MNLASGERLAALAVLAAAPWPAYGPALHRGFVRCFPRAWKQLVAGLAVYAAISLAGFFVRSTADFYALALMVGVVQGGTQALSRSLFAAMVPKTHSAEFFGFFSTGEKVAGIIGPAIFGLIGQLTGSSRWGIVSITMLFAGGALLLRRVDVAEACRVAAQVDASV